MRSDVGAALALLLVAASVASAATTPAAAGPDPRGAPPPPALPAPLAAAGPPTPPSACCAMLAAAGFTRSVGVPVVLIDTAAGLPTRTKQNATLCTCGAGEVGVPGAGGQAIGDWAGPIKLKVRGGTNTQRYNPIRQYAAYLSKSDAPPFVLGLDGDHLVFLGQVNDTGGVKESMGRDLARAMGGAPPLTPLPSSPYATWSAPRGPLGWVPRTVHVELFLADDGRPPASEPAHYRGLYLASEHISRGKFKLDLPKPKDGDARTAAIATFLHGEKDPDATTITGGSTSKEWQVKWPDKAELTRAQAASLAAELGAFESALFEGPAPGANSTAAGWRAHMDEASFIDWFLVTELWKVAKKSYHSASFLHKPAPGARLKMGPVWAQLQGAGTCCGYNFISQPSGFNGPGRSGGSGVSSSGWLFSICRERAPDGRPRCTPLDGPDGRSGYDVGNGLAVWFGEAFFGDPAFAPAAAARWVQLRSGPWSNEGVAGMVRTKRALLTGGPLERTLARWPQFAKPWLGDSAAQTAAVFGGVATWTAARLAWMDGAFAQAADPASRGDPYPALY